MSDWLMLEFNMTRVTDHVWPPLSQQEQGGVVVITDMLLSVVTVITNLVTITAIQAGHKTLNDEDERSKNNAVRIAADIPLSDVNADLTGSVDYDLVSKNANVRIGYHKDDITVKLRTLIKEDGDKRTAASTINLDYSGLEGIGVGVEVKDDKTGHLQITKDDFKLKVPIEENSVKTNNASITYNWAIDM